jgi:hypothetical protein
LAPKKIEMGATFSHSPTTSTDWQGIITHLSHGATQKDAIATSQG